MTKKNTATMQKVADATGVSVSTVSRVFNSSEFAKQETRARIIRAADRLGYTRLRRRAVSYPMTSLGRNHASTADLGNIVLLASEIVLRGLESQDWIYRDVVPTLHRLEREKGFHLILSSYGRDDQWDPAAITADHIGGVLWMAHDREDLLDRINRTVPVVVINDNTLWPPRTSVVTSDRMVLFKATEHLAGLGHRRVAYFADDATLAELPGHDPARLAAYHDAIAHFNLDTDPSLCVLEQFGINEHPQAVARAMDHMLSMETRPTALITSLRYSIQFLKEARRCSIAVPTELSIVAIDNAPAAEFVDPSLTVVDCVFGRCAEVAIEMLLEQKNGPPESVRTVLIEPKLIVRKSTARPRRTQT